MMVAAKQGLCALAVLATLATNALARDAKEGEALARRLCAHCHMLPGQGEKQKAGDVPSFAAVAARPDQSYESIVRWLQSRPTMMPDHHLSQDESFALAAYILSLAPR
jgi:mono/diheme cytochrome c family protein